MGIKSSIDQGRLDAFMAKAENEVVSQIKTQLSYLGQECVTRIRKNRTNWQDQTHNLRSSIGAEVVTNGRARLVQELEVESGKNGKGETTSGDKGVKVGKKYLRECAKDVNSDIALIVVAGMDYASYLEEHHSRDVLSGTELWARKELQGRLDDAVNNAAVRINNMRI